ncbi:hypothetical protein EV363DRAFT_1403307 [Boletus edulis]|nr:hypothetical protein EV363DRAFT_1403307 [Boletus edulis]
MPPRRSQRSSPKGKSKAGHESDQGKGSTPSASWSDSDVECLIDQVVSRWAEGGDGMNFKAPFWKSIAESNKLANPTKGAPKTKSSCKEKWSRLKKTFKAVHSLTTLSSGLTYSLESGANIGPSDELVWEELVRANGAVAPFKNKGWKFYDKMKVIMPTNSSGTNRFAANPAEAEPVVNIHITPSPTKFHATNCSLLIYRLIG